MKTLRDYETLIRDCVNKINEKDVNWNWSVKSFAKDRVCIRWSYLDYCEEKNNCFFLILKDYDEEDNEYFLVERTPYDELIDGHLVSDNDKLKSWQESFENAIKSAIEEIAYYAHTRY